MSLWLYLGDQVHAVSEGGDEPYGGVPVEGGQLLLPHQSENVPEEPVLWNRIRIHKDIVLKLVYIDIGEDCTAEVFKAKITIANH